MFIFDNTVNNTYFTDNPPDPSFLIESQDPSFIQPFIQPNTSLTVNPSFHHYVLQRSYQPNDALARHGAFTSRDGPVLPQQPLLLSLETDLGCFDLPSSSSKAPNASASALASSVPVPATLAQGDASGFDQLALFDEVCASAFSTPFTPHLDTPDPTPHQTPLFDTVASEDPVFEISPDNHVCQGLDLGVDLNLDLELALSFVSPISNASPLAPTPATSTDLSIQAGLARLQAENALIDFVLYDDIAHPSPISSLLTTPETTVLSPPCFADTMLKQESEADQIAMQLVAAAAASMISPSSAPSALDAKAPDDIIGSLFSDVDLSPPMGSIPISTLTSTSASPANPALTPSPHVPMDWNSIMPSTQNFVSGLENNDSICNTNFKSTIGAGANTGTCNSNSTNGPESLPILHSNAGAALSHLQLQQQSLAASPMVPVFNVTPSPQLDLGLLFSLCSQEQQQAFLASLARSTVAAAAAAAAAAAISQQQQQSGQVSSSQDVTSNISSPSSSSSPLKRKSDEIKSSSEDDASSTAAPAARQFSCSQCGRSFSRLFNLNTHERTHDRSKARLFACPETGCKKSFTRKNDLQRHQISIHGVTHLYSCQKCDKPFLRKDELRRHLDNSCEQDS